ncbi:MAG: ABC transporter permease [Candidatus Aminicenantaceae bacterium]
MTPEDTYIRPPRLAEWLLKRMFPEKGIYSLVGDVAETFQHINHEKGRSPARFWYRIQLVKAIPSFIKDFFYWRFTMFGNYAKLAYRHMLRQKGYSFINIAGLAIGMACTILILFWVRDELSFDRFHAHKQDLYRVTCIGTETSFFGSPAPFAPAIITEIPEVEDAVRVMRAPRFVFKRGEKAFYEENGISADPSFFDMFSFEILKGDPKTAFASPLNIALTESLARKYFGDEDPLGKSIQLEGRADIRIAAVLADVPANSHLQFDYVLPHKFIEVSRLCGMRWGDFNFMTYLKASPTRDEALLIQKLNDVSEKHGCPQIVEKQLTFSIQSLEEIYLNPLGNYDIPLGNKRFVYLFSVIALFILFIACVNFINLSTARSERRAREVGLRKVVGAARIQVIKQFFGESIILALLSLLLAVMAAWLLMPVFNGLTGKSLSFDIFDPMVLLGLLGITCLAGLLAGLYPALYLSSFEPINVLRNNLMARSWLKRPSNRQARKGSLRRILVVAQFSLSIILILATMVVYNQLTYMRDKSWNPGDDVMLHIPFKDNLSAKHDLVKNELLKHPNITAVAAKDVVPTSLRNNTSGVGWEGKTEDQSGIHMETTRVGFDYFPTMGMEIVAGRGFSREFAGDIGKAFVLNEEAVRVAGIEDPVGKRFRLYGNTGTIVGVVKNTYFHSLRTELRPQVFYLFTNLAQQTFGGVMLIRVQAPPNLSALQDTIAHLERAWSSVNSIAPFEYNFLDETIAAQYGNEQRLGRLFGYFAFLAVFISCLGLVGLASFMAERRTKEIGIRKTLGAGLRDIVIMLSRDFTLWVLAANLIAWPVAWLVMQRWLQNFAYRTPIAWWSFPAAGTIALVIAWITVSLQTFRAARSNPVDALRYE